MSDARAQARAHEGAEEYEEALALFLSADAFGDAARVAWQLRRYEQSVELAEKAGNHFLAALCFIKLENEKRALYHLVRLSPDDKNYRVAAIRAVTLAITTKVLDMRFDNFIHRFTVDKPQSNGEMRALFALGTLYVEQGFAAAAEQCFDTVLKADPDHLKATAAKAALKKKTRPHVKTASAKTQETQKNVLSAEMSFRRADRRSRREDTQSLMPPPTEKKRFWVPSLDIGQTIGERYEIKSLLGRGGMATVFEVEDLELAGRLALKIFSKLMTSEDEEERFRREASLSRRLNHHNIIRVWDIGKVHGYKFITMELLRGKDLAQIISETGRLEVVRSLKLLRQAAAGLGYAHQRKVVHRDVKPSNFFIDAHDELKIMDFGIAKEHGAKKLTSTGVILGTPEYISPEQIHDFAGAQKSTDLYALGIMAYRMLTGQLPFDCPEHVEILLLHLNEKPKPPREILPALPASVERMVLRLLEKDPADRYPTCEALGAELDRLIVEQGGTLSVQP